MSCLFSNSQSHIRWMCPNIFRAVFFLRLFFYRLLRESLNVTYKCLKMQSFKATITSKNNYYFLKNKTVFEKWHKPVHFFLKKNQPNNILTWLFCKKREDKKITKQIPYHHVLTDNSAILSHVLTTNSNSKGPPNENAGFLTESYGSIKIHIARL